MAKSITRRTLRGFRHAKVNTRYYENLINQVSHKSAKLIAQMKQGKNYWKANEDNDMKFTAIVGNPPYQIVNKGNGNGADPVYHLFINIAMQMAEQGTLIHPARFLFNAGKTPKEWNTMMLNNIHYKVSNYWVNSSDVFPSVEINGGIVTSYWNKRMDFGTIGFFSAFNELRDILRKVQEKSEISFSTIVGPRELYSVTEELYKENPELDGRQSKGHKYSLGANIFDVFPELFFDDCDSSNEYAKVFGRYCNQRCYKWVKSSYITHPTNFAKYKVIISKADGAAGKIGSPIPARIIGKTEIGEPYVAYTDTFIGIGCFDTYDEACACQKYLMTKFARTMLGTVKVTQDNPKEAWINVPIQDFTDKSDIDWSMSVVEIDQQLYAKYGLDESEIAFIESKIKPME